MKKYPIYNENGEDNGLVISMRKQGNQWVADVTNNKIAYWQEQPLHYSVTTKQQAKDWAFQYADGQRFQLRF